MIISFQGHKLSLIFIFIFYSTVRVEIFETLSQLTNIKF